MKSKQGFSVQYDRNLEKYIKNSELIGKGHNGIVYKLKSGKIMKVFKDSKTCKEEFETLKKASKTSLNFPKVYMKKTNYIIRDYVDGIRLDKYIKKNQLDEKLATELFKLIEDFKKIKFTRLDIRCKDIYVLKDFKLMVIDPKHQYSKIVSYPRHLMKGLSSLGVIDVFLSYLKKYNPADYNLWSEKFNLYKNKHIK